MPAGVSLRARLADGPALVAVFSIINAPEAVELLALAGFDAVILDNEHGPYGVESLGPLLLAARASGVYAIVRVRANEPSLIGAALDAGADGVLVPQVASAAEAHAAVAAARFAPLGSRGANPYVRAARYSSGPEWFAQANEDTAVLVMVEGSAGIDALPFILEVEALDGVFVGPVDLSHALGVPGQTDHPMVVEKAGSIIASARAAGLSTAVFAPTAEAARRWLDHGVGLVAYGVDSGLALAGYRAAIAALGESD
jgi:4-hydroxy-2-oxoheptanedioate aldolase